MKQYVENFFETVRKKNMGAKLASILLAVVLWAYISSIKSGDIKFKIPVSFKNLDDGFVISKISQSNVLVNVHGKTEELKNTQANNIRIYVDLHKAELDRYKFYRLKYTRNEIPEGIDVELNPSEIKVLVEKKVVKDIKIDPKYRGNVARGYLIGKISVIPPMVQVTGPRSRLNDIDYISTKEILIDDRNETVKEVVDLETFEKEDLTYNVKKVKIVIPVISYSQIKIIDLPVQLVNPLKGYNYSFEIEDAKVKVTVSNGEAVGNRDYLAYIDLSQEALEEKDFASSKEIKKVLKVIVKGNKGVDANDVISVTPVKIPVLIRKD